MYQCIHLNRYAEQQQFYLLPPANEVWGKVIFLHLSVILFTGRGALPQCMLDTTSLGPGTPPGADIPLGVDTPQSRHPLQSRHPPAQCMLGDTANKRAVRILLECILVFMCEQRTKLRSTRGIFFFRIKDGTIDYTLVPDKGLRWSLQNFGKRISVSHYIGGSNLGLARDALPGPISFIFTQFLGKNWPNSSWCHHRLVNSGSATALTYI